MTRYEQMSADELKRRRRELRAAYHRLVKAGKFNEAVAIEWKLKEIRRVLDKTREVSERIKDGKNKV